MQDPRSPTPPSSFKDRTVRLRLFGAMAVLVGCVSALFGLLHLMLLFGAGRLPGTEGMPVDARSYVLGGVLYLLLGGAFVWAGRGSFGRRRWSRPLMLTLAWTWLLGGVSLLLLLPGMLGLVLGGGAAGGAALDPTLVDLVQRVLLGGVAVFGVLLPALFVWTYSDPNLRRTCEAHDRRPDWTSRCPTPVLGLSLGLGACGAIAALMAVRPALPLFGFLVTGWAGALLLLAGAGVFFWLARATYDLTRFGWWATTALCALVGLSTWLTLDRVEPDAWFRAMGYPEGSPPVNDTGFRSIGSWLTVAVTLLSVVYMAAIRRHFRRPANGSASPSAAGPFADGRRK